MHFSSRRYDAKIAQNVIRAINDNGPSGYRRLKQKVEGKQYLDRILHSNTFGSCIRMLRYHRILTNAPKDKKPGRIVPIDLTKTAKAKDLLKTLIIPDTYIIQTEIKDKKRRNVTDNFRSMRKESKEEKNRRMYQLLLLFGSIEDDQIHEISPTEMLKLLSIIQINSIDDLEVSYIENKDFARIITTVYKPISCLLIWKQEIHHSLPRTLDPRAVGSNIGNTTVENSNKLSWLQLRDMIMSTRLSRGPNNYDHEQSLNPFVMYYVKILGVSIGDFARRNRWFMFKDVKFAKSQLQNAFRVLEKELKIISPIGELDNEKRYSITNESLKELIKDCWNVYGWTVQKKSMEWMYTRPPTSEERRALYIAYGYERAEKIRRDNADMRRLISANGAKNSEAVAAIKKDTDTLNRIAESYINSLRQKYENVIEKYDFLVDDLIEIIINPRLFIWKTKSQRKSEVRAVHHRFASIPRSKNANNKG